VSEHAGGTASIVIVTYNGARWLRTCLPAIESTVDLATQVIVVDNASSDDSAEVVRAHGRVQYVRSEVNLGYAGGNNLGARSARGDHLLFLNNDTRPRPGWLGAMLRATCSDPRVAIVAPRIVGMDDPAVVDSAGDGWTRWGAAFKRGHGRPAAEYAHPGEVFGACGAALLIARLVFEELEGFDDKFFLGFEDVDLCFRARLVGYRCAYAPDAIVEHAGSATMGRLSETAVFYGQRNVEWTYLKNTPWPLLALTLPGHTLATAAAAVYFAKQGRLRTFLRAKAAAFAGLPAVLRKRRRWQRRRQASLGDLWRVMEPRTVRLKLAEKRRSSR
jgi:GT2 family glycosyltransferase